MTTEEFNLYAANFEELYNKLLEVIENEDENGKTIKNKREVKEGLEVIKWGENIRVPWYVMINEEEYKEEGDFVYYKQISFKGYGTFNLNRYMLEKDTRMTLMRSIIKEYDTDEPMTDPE